jgi:2-keto-4-pentenoate hydratase/2-oxohepta-3-ene-1,7-dioic acid hydratase in catechol pathway
MRRKIFALGIALVFGWFLIWQVAARWPVSQLVGTPTGSQPPEMGRLEIAPRGEALTFARFARGGEPHLLLVTRFSDGQVSGIDIQQQLPGSASDPISLFNATGYSTLEELSGTLISVDVKDLLLPFSGTDNQIAVGINYPAHSEETSVDDSFLFPKRTTATTHVASVQARDYLLDYEIELGFVLLNDLGRGELPKFMGLVLSSDYTDRAALMRHANLRDVSSGDGFTRGKSERGFMPTGNLFVIPKDYLRFYKTLKLELWYNGEKRQEANPSELTWDIQRIFVESFARETRTWMWNGEPVALPMKDGRILERTMFLSGTPGGVIYQKPTPRQMFLGISELFFSLHWSQLQTVVEPFLREQYRSGRYLKPGDLVLMKADRLGTMSNRIVAQ